MVSSKIARKILCAGAALALSVSVVSGTPFAQDADAGDRYAALLQQISDLKMSISQKEAYLAQQEGQIESLQSQIDALPATKETIRPIVTQMVSEIEKEINKDVPFRQLERFNRLDRLKEDLANPAVGESELFRQAMVIYDVEVNYGNSVSSYPGNNPINPGTRFAACEANQLSAKCDLSDDQKDAIKSGATVPDLKDTILDGNFLHFGRLSLVYLEQDSSEGYRYNQDTKEWDKLPSGDIIGIRKAVRISRGESAPGTLTGPVTLSGAAQ